METSKSFFKELIERILVESTKKERHISIEGINQLLSELSIFIPKEIIELEYHNFYNNFCTLDEFKRFYKHFIMYEMFIECGNFYNGMYHLLNDEESYLDIIINIEYSYLNPKDYGNILIELCNEYIDKLENMGLIDYVYKKTEILYPNPM